VARQNGDLLLNQVLALCAGFDIVFDVGQAKQFIAAISGHEYEASLALALTTGMRPSEYLALTWTDFNLEHGTVSVSKTLEMANRRMVLRGHETGA
jgi:integrase